MPYVVHDLSGLPTSPKARLLDCVSYPPHELPDKILTKITLWEVESNVGGMLTWAYWKSVFNWRPDYNVIVRQVDPIKNKSYTFVVHESDNEEVAREAFKAVYEVLEPLVDDCFVILTKQLLEGIITPEPRNANDLSYVLTELMQTNPKAHPHWSYVLQALWKGAVGRACGDGKEDEIALLAEKAADTSHSDHQGNTCAFLHHAIAAGSAKGVQSLTENISEEDKQKILHETNEDGKAAIHCAFERNDPDIVRCLIESGADLNMSAKDGDGSNPFHLAAQTNCAQSIHAVNHGEKDFTSKRSSSEKQSLLKALDAFNKSGFTPLMMAVMSDNTDCAVALLQAEANPNVQHVESGNTAIHYAAEKCNAVILKALIVFGGDISIKNKAGQIPLDIALKASKGDTKVCVETLQKIADLTKEAAKTYAAAPKLPAIDPDAVFLMCLDGGGVRGLLSLQILMAIRNRMKQIQPDCAPFQDYFDYLAGTSIGGLITLASSALNASLEESRADLFKVVDYVFPTKPTFTLEAADDIAKGTFGLKMKISEIKSPRIIVHTVEANVNPPILHKVRNFGANKSDWHVWEAGRATTAAPIYFPPHKDRYIDGGVMANNPTLSAMTEVVQAAVEEKKQAKFGLVVSIGTGHGPSLPVKDVGVYVPSLTTLLNIPSTLSALGSVMNLFIGQSTTSDGEVVDSARAWCTSVGAQYFRLSPLLSTPIDLAEYKKPPIVQMLYEGVVFGLTNASDINTIARIILTRKPNKST